MGIFKNFFSKKPVKTGSGFKSTYGQDSLHEILRDAKRSMSSTLGNVSYEELDKLEKVIAKRAKRLPTGAGFSSYTKRYMKEDVYDLYKKHEITEEDMKDFKKIIDAL